MHLCNTYINTNVDNNIVVDTIFFFKKENTLLI